MYNDMHIYGKVVDVVGYAGFMASHVYCNVIQRNNTSASAAGRIRIRCGKQNGKSTFYPRRYNFRGPPRYLQFRANDRGYRGGKKKEPRQNQSRHNGSAPDRRSTAEPVWGDAKTATSQF